MKKILGILCLIFFIISYNYAYAFSLRCEDHATLKIVSLEKNVEDVRIEYRTIDIILDNSGSVHITSYYNSSTKFIEVFGNDGTSEYEKKLKKIKNREDRKEFADKRRWSMNPLIKNPNDGAKNEYFTTIGLKAGHKIRTNFIYDEKELTTLKFVEYYDIDLKSMEVKRYLTVTPETKELWNSTFTEKDEKAGFKKIGKAKLINHFVNCKNRNGKNSYLDYWWAVILILAITFFIFTQSGKRLKQIRRK